MYIQSISRPADVGLRPLRGKRLLGWLIGDGQRSEQLLKPFGIALDEADNLCLTDTGRACVCFYDRQRKAWKRYEKVGKIQLVSPVAVAKRGDTFFVADSALQRVLAFDEKGKLRFAIAEPLERPSGLAIADAKLFVADSVAHCVRVYSLQGKPLTRFGQRGGGAGEFNFPTHITADGNDRLYVTDSMNSRIQVFDTGGSFQRMMGSAGDSSGHFSRPKGVAVDAFGHVYVVDALFDNIQIFDPEGRFLLDVGGAGTAPGEFWLPNGIAISRDNVIYVADSYNRRVQVLQYVGEP